MKLSDEQRQMVEGNLGIAYYVANKFRDNGLLDYQEILSIAFESLTVAALKHQPSKGAKFRTYAFRIVRYHILYEITERRKQQFVQQELFQSYVDIANVLESDINPQTACQLELIINELRDFKGSQRDKAAVITFVRNPGLTQKEIADKAGVSQKKVSTAITNFRKQLLDVI